jgi:hypothetical protein
MEVVMEDFKALYNLPNIDGAIDNTYFCIWKLIGQFSQYYFYYKYGGYFAVCQVVVDDRK